MAPPLTEPKHGTIQRYKHRTLKCRCGACRRANADYMQSLRDRAKAPVTPDDVNTILDSILKGA